MNEAIVLAGGLGTRLRAVVAHVPKPMASVAGKPFLEFLLSRLGRHGMSRVVLSVGYKASEVIRYFGRRFEGIELDYSIEDEPLGTGGAVRESLLRCQSDHVLIANGDTYLELDLSAVEQAWAVDRNPIIVARKVDDVGRYGSLLIDQGRVLAFAEKVERGEGLINAGCYVFPRDVFRVFPHRKRFSLESDFLVTAVRSTPFNAFVTNGYFIDIGIPEDYARAQRELPSRCA